MIARMTTAPLLSALALPTGSPGDDTLGGTGADDTLDGAAGDDVLHGDAGSDSLLGGDGDDTLFGGAHHASDETPGDGGDTLRGGAGGDWLYGDAGNDVMAGGDGNDDIHGDGGSDRLDGGEGYDDLAYMFSERGHFAGNGDTAVRFDASALVGPGEALIADGFGGEDTVSGFEALYVEDSTGADTITGSQMDDLIYADYGGDDWVSTGLGDDLLNGGPGNDSLNGGAGNDRLDGDVGADQLRGGAGSDVLNGGADSDTLTGGGASGGDTLDGGDGVDTADYKRADQAVRIDLDNTWAGIGIDLIYDVENLAGSAFNDELGGSSLGNLLAGAGGDDWLRGFQGSDTLKGGAGSDTLTGGSGRDVFVLDIGDSLDFVEDFHSGADTVRINASAFGLPAAPGAPTLVAGPGGFGPGAGLVIITQDVVEGVYSVEAVAARIGSASSAYAVGDRCLFVVDNGFATGLHLFTAADADAVVEASELTLVAVLWGTSRTELGDFVFG